MECRHIRPVVTPNKALQPTVLASLSKADG